MPAYYDEAEELATGGRRRLRAKLLVGFALIALIATGGGAYRMLGGPASETLPFVTAADGPARVAPETSGARKQRYADVEAYRIIDGEGAVATAAVGFAAEPGRPSEEDMAMSKIAAVTALPSSVPLSATAPRPASFSGTTALPQGTPAAVHRPTAPGGARIALRDGERLAALHTEDSAFDAPEAMGTPRVHRLIPSEMELLDTTAPVVTRVISRQREANPPEGVGSAFAPATSPFVRQRPTLLADAEPKSELALAAERSPFQIQLGAFPELDIIESEWERVSRANSDVLGDRAMALQKTQAGGVVYYRLRVGPFADGQEASTVCQALKARGYDCLVAINTGSRS